jgi:hypothetical protein
MRTATRPASLLTVAVLAGCLTASGCIPGVTWTPDSRGFYFTGGKDYQKLFYFDVASRKTRLVAADTEGATLWPAVSPDGKRVAVAVPVRRDGKTQSQVVVYDAQGKEVQRSRPFALKPLTLNKGAQKDQGPPFWLFWAPRGQGDKVLLQAAGGCGLLELKEDRFTDLGDGVLWVFGNSPVRPDGKGFLTLRPQAKEGEKEVAAFHDWQGNKQAVSGSDAGALNRLGFPFLFASRWQGDVATARGGALELAVDTDKLTATVAKGRPERTAESLVIRQQYRFGREGVRVRVIELEDDPKKEIPLRIEVLPPGAALRVLDEKAALTTLLPSPDGKTLVVRYLVGGPGRIIADRVVVIDAQGEILADINTLKE